jgi:hypothetical protein
VKCKHRRVRAQDKLPQVAIRHQPSYFFTLIPSLFNNSTEIPLASNSADDITHNISYTGLSQPRVTMKSTTTKQGHPHTRICFIGLFLINSIACYRGPNHRKSLRALLGNTANWNCKFRHLGCWAHSKITLCVHASCWNSTNIIYDHLGFGIHVNDAIAIKHLIHICFY